MKENLLVLLMLVASTKVGAVCFQNNPLAPAAGSLQIHVGESPESLWAFGKSPHGSTQSPYPADPPPLLDQSRFVLPQGSSSPLQVWFYEPDTKAKFRVCRVDSWVTVNSFDHSVELARKCGSKAPSSPLQESLERKNHIKAFSTIYRYDAQGRIASIEQADLRTATPPKFKPVHCRRYDNADQVTLWVNPKHTEQCPTAEPSNQDEWRQYKYGSNKGEEVTLLSRWHIPGSNGSWEERWEPFRTGSEPDAPWGSAKVDSQRGVHEIFGSNYGKLDDNAANTVVNEFGRWNGSNYYFTKPPVPISVLANPEEIYKYDRRRVTHVDEMTKLIEFFKAGSHRSAHRYYMFAGFVARHEQLDQNGKVKRIITINDWKQPRPGPKPDFNDDRLGSKVPRLFAHQVYHKVYDIDAKGQPILVALSWNRALLNPLKRTPLSVADLAFGTPDGKENGRTAMSSIKRSTQARTHAKSFRTHQRMGNEICPPS